MALRAHVQFTPFDASSGAALTSATVNVFQPGTVTPVAGTLFDKSSGTLANPLTSDATTGLVDFYMNVAQEVDLQVAKSGFTTRTYSNVPVLDDAGNDLTALMIGTGDIVYSSAANTPARLAIGATGTFLTNTGASTPGWSNTIAAGGLTITAGGLTVTAAPVIIGSGNIATVGSVRFPNNVAIAWRSPANSTDQAFYVNGSSQFVFGDAGAGVATATTATAGAQTLPANPAGFLNVVVNGTTQKIPYYNN